MFILDGVFPCIEANLSLIYPEPAAPAPGVNKLLRAFFE